MDTFVIWDKLGSNRLSMEKRRFLAENICRPNITTTPAQYSNYNLPNKHAHHYHWHKYLACNENRGDNSHLRNIERKHRSEYRFLLRPLQDHLLDNSSSLQDSPRQVPNHKEWSGLLLRYGKSGFEFAIRSLWGICADLYESVSCGFSFGGITLILGLI